MTAEKEDEAQFGSILHCGRRYYSLREEISFNEGGVIVHLDVGGNIFYGITEREAFAFHITDQMLAPGPGQTFE